MRLQEFESKQKLMEAFCSQNEMPVRYATVECTGAKYRAHQYRGGWVIPNFGYETSRVGTYNVTVENYGDPVLACSWEKAGDDLSTLANWNSTVKTIAWGGANGVDHGSMWEGQKLLKEW